MSEIRWNSMLGEWVIVTPDRADRPFQDREIQCPFCPDQEETKGEWNVLTLDNRFAALQPDIVPPNIESSLVIGAPAHGYCKVIVESRKHNEQIEDMDTSQLKNVYTEFLRVFTELEKQQGIEYVFQFENRGKSIGVSLNHPHAQVYALPFVPPRIQREIEQFKKNREENGECLVCEAIEHEAKSGERMISESENFVSLIPYGARLPYEVHVYPKQHVANLEGIESILEEFGLMLSDIAKRYAAVFDENAYVMAFHTSPKKLDKSLWHFHVEFYPPWRDKSRIKYRAGVELGAWVYTNDSSPEEKAKELREALVE
ncbi:MAG: galactose-1-phosphate uridylyltransferase [Candidatus Thorarchaeota archaeon]